MGLEKVKRTGNQERSPQKWEALHLEANQTCERIFSTKTKAIFRKGSQGNNSPSTVARLLL